MQGTCVSLAAAAAARAALSRSAMTSPAAWPDLPPCGRGATNPGRLQLRRLQGI